MTRTIRITIGGLLAIMGVVLFILPGSILLLLSGLLLLSYDLPQARGWLRHCQNAMTQGARKLDRFLLKRKMR